MPQVLEPIPGRFLHLIPDDKFIDAARGIFEDAAEGKHDYLIVGAPHQLQYIHTFEPHSIELETALGSPLLSQLPRYSAIFVHFLNNAARAIVANAPVEANFIWLGWGADYYHLIDSSESLLLPKTRALVSELTLEAKTNANHHPFLRTLRAARSPSKVVRHIRSKHFQQQIGPGSLNEPILLNRFRGVAMPIAEDYLAMRRRNPDIAISFVDWNYWTEGFRPEHDCPGPTGNNILLGNSATPTNNHVEALECIARSPLRGRKIICPLSYGDSRYAAAIEKIGTQMFGSDFVPLRGYLAPAEYSEVIRSCSVVVMNHIRQQAMGNILMALCSGATVFLNHKSPITESMRRLDVDVRRLDDMPKYFQDQEQSITSAELGDVRRILGGQYGRTSILRRTRVLLGRLIATPYAISDFSVL